MTDPTNVFAMDDIKFMTGYNVEPVVASETAVGDAITRYYALGKPAAAHSVGDGRVQRPRDGRQVDGRDVDVGRRRRR